MTMVCSLCGRRYPDNVQVCPADGNRLTPLSTDPYIERQLGKYKLETRIGRGGFGVVYLARHQELGNEVAIKILKKQYTTDDQLVERFRREARVASQINHENVVQTLDFGYDDELGFYYVMEYLDGISLSDAMKQYPRGMPLSRMAPIMRQICGALHQAHQNNIVHRDLKPSNIFLIKRFTQDDVVKILDFGIAKVIQSEEGKGVTMTGQIVGSPRFMSPEQARGRHSEVDPRSDIYSLGVMMFWMLTGRLPFESKQLARLLFMHVKTPPPPLSSVAGAQPLPGGLEQVVASALGKRKNERPDTALILYERFEAAIDDQPTAEHLQQATPRSLPNADQLTKSLAPSSREKTDPHHSFHSQSLSHSIPPTQPLPSHSSSVSLSHSMSPSAQPMVRPSSSSLQAPGQAHTPVPQYSPHQYSYSSGPHTPLPRQDLNTNPISASMQSFAPSAYTPITPSSYIPEPDDGLDFTQVDANASDMDFLRDEENNIDSTLIAGGSRRQQTGDDDEDIRTVMEVPLGAIQTSTQPQATRPTATPSSTMKPWMILIIMAGFFLVGLLVAGWWLGSSLFP